MNFKTNTPAGTLPQAIGTRQQSAFRWRYAILAAALAVGLVAPTASFAQSKKSKDDPEMESKEKNDSKKDKDKEKSDPDSMDKDKKDKDEDSGFGVDRKKASKSKPSRADRAKDKEKKEKSSDKGRDDDDKKAKDKRTKAIEAVLPRKKEGFFLVDLIETKWETNPTRPQDVDPYRGQQGNNTQKTKRAVTKHDFWVIEGRSSTVDKIVDFLGEGAPEPKGRSDRRERSSSGSGSSSSRKNRNSPPPSKESTSADAPAEHSYRFIGYYTKQEEANRQKDSHEARQKQEEETARQRGMR